MKGGADMFGKESGWVHETANGTARLREALDQTETVIIGAGAGLSASAGFSYSGERFDRYFHDFSQRYGFTDMYSGGFYPYDTLEEFWAYWSRYIYINRYTRTPRPIYERLLELMKGKDYFVITTNVDHCFQRAGFDKSRLFYTQGDYGLWQCSKPCCQETYDNEREVREMVEAQGYVIAEDGSLTLPDGVEPAMSIPQRMVPKCPRCGRPMSMNLRSDETFVQDRGWEEHAAAYERFLREHSKSKTLFLDLGSGGNTPVIFKIPFMRMTYSWPRAVYASLNTGEAFAPADIRKRSICINDDIGKTLSEI